MLKEKYRRFLPALLQKQVQFSAELARQVGQGDVTWEELIEAILTGDSDWDALYHEYIDQFESAGSTSISSWQTEILVAERQAYDLLWDGQYQTACEAYEVLAERASAQDPGLGAWYMHLLGLARLCSEDAQGAFSAFIGAANVRAELGRPSGRADPVFRAPEAPTVTSQARAIAGILRRRKSKMRRWLAQVESDLKYGPETKKAEEALRILGEALGLVSERPDSETGTGPDVVWYCSDGGLTIGFELKSNSEVEYRKEDIGQCHDHSQWLSNRYGADSALLLIGRHLPVSSKANPPESLKVIELEAVRDLLFRLRQLIDSSAANDPGNLEQSIQGWLNYYGLDFPRCVHALASKLAADLKR